MLRTDPTRFDRLLDQIGDTKPDVPCMCPLHYGPPKPGRDVLTVPGWDFSTARQRLNIALRKSSEDLKHEVSMIGLRLFKEGHATDPIMEEVISHAVELQGNATEDGVWISPLCIMPIKTAAHELAHVRLRHVFEKEQKPEHEAEADAVAMLVSDALGFDDYVQASRQYIYKHWPKPLTPEMRDRIKATATDILSAGAVPVEVRVAA